MRNESLRISKWIKNSNELLGLIVGIVTSVIFLLSKFGKIESIGEEQLLLGVDFLNIAVLVIALTSIKAVELGIADNEIGKLKQRLPLNNEAELETLRGRVNELVKQLVYCVRWFAIILGMFYLLQVITDFTLSRLEDEIKITLNHESSTSIIELMAGNLPCKVEAAKYLALEIFTNATNLFSASYLFLAFQVLFLVTIDTDNKTWRLKSYIPVSIAVAITIANVIVFLVGLNGNTLSNLSHMIRLMGGIYNGLAMLLLFSRFISMEYFFQNSAQSWQRNFYFYGTVIGLPLYVIAQPMYGVFNAVEIGESAVLFKSLVFLVCFWGKLVFLLFIFTMLKKRWIHTYIFIALTQKDTLSHISKDLGDVDDL